MDYDEKEQGVLVITHNYTTHTDNVCTVYCVHFRMILIWMYCTFMNRITFKKNLHVIINPTHNVVEDCCHTGSVFALIFHGGCGCG